MQQEFSFVREIDKQLLMIMDDKKEKESTKVVIKEAGKGDSPRNIFSNDFRKNYDGVKWSRKKK